MIKENSEVILSVKNLTANVEGKEILKGLNLEIKAGEIHAIMGQNGSGKSTFSKVIFWMLFGRNSNPENSIFCPENPLPVIITI